MEASSSLYNVASNVYLTCELRLKCESGFAYHKTFVYEPTPGGQSWSIVQRCCTLVTFCRFCWCLAITFCECVPALWDVKHVMSLLKCFSYIEPNQYIHAHIFLRHFSLQELLTGSIRRERKDNCDVLTLISKG